MNAAGPADTAFFVSCEHGGNRVPPAYRGCFSGQGALLRSHRGYDPGALALARELANALPAPLIYATTSRLLVDLNRSPGHPRLFSPTIRALPAATRQAIFEAFYLPYRQRAEHAIREAMAGGARLIHLSSHSFTPVLDGVERNADVGLLYDPARPGEAALCLAWQAALKAAAPGWRVRRNYPYTGKSDGLTAYLRRQFDGARYVGVEIEINQRIARAGGADWRRLRAELIAALQAALARYAW